MTCERLQKNMAEYLDGVLSAEEQNTIETHLSHCEQCRQEVQEIKQSLDWIKQTEDISPPPRLRHNVLKQLEREANRKQHYRFPFWMTHAAAAALFIMLLAGNAIIPLTMNLASDEPPADMRLLLPSVNGAETFIQQENFQIMQSDDVEHSIASDVEEKDEHDTSYNITISTGSKAYPDESIVPQPKRALSPRVIFNLVFVPPFLLLAWLALRKRRDGLSGE